MKLHNIHLSKYDLWEEVRALGSFIKMAVRVFNGKSQVYERLYEKYWPAVLQQIEMTVYVI